MGGTHQKVSPFDGVGSKGVDELNCGTRNEPKEVRDGLAGEGHGLADEDESRINQAAMDLNEAHLLEAAVKFHVNPVLEKLQHQPSAPIVRWERFLPFRTLKVLLVENDDSTLQVLCALLRNCCYDVTAVANGLEAWRVLQDQTNHIDLVLTEVVMPGWSGIGLLCKIMSHKTHKTIPVIMMSSNDSMGIVFKCLSKGAVDFLVKPIRKNELKNLWQHVWRRCHSSSGSISGSESGIQGQKYTKLKSLDDSDNNTGSNDEEDNGSIGLSARDGSDNGSDTQSSWTKRAVEADNPQPISPSEHLAGPCDSTCAQVIHPKSEAFCSKKVPVNASIDWKEQKKIAADDIMDTDLRNESYQTDRISTKLTGPSTEKLHENMPNNIDVVLYMNYGTIDEPHAQAPAQLGSSSINTNQQSVLGPPDTSKDFLKISENKDNGYVELPSLVPSLELSLKRVRSRIIPSNDERNVLKHSNLSAFSRYPASVASVQTPTAYGGNSVFDNGSEAAPLQQGSNGSSNNNNDKGSTSINVVMKPLKYIEVSTSAFHRVQSQCSSIQPVTQEKIDAVAPVIEQLRGSQKKVQVQHHHHHYHHYHHHVHALQPQLDQDDSSVENLKGNVEYCNSSNVFATPVEANAANYSLNGSNSGSNHGSDGQKGCSTAINAGGTNIESTMGVAERNGVVGSGSGADQNRFAQREAALNKFRQKRKERNFGKKVRYQSRKRLAEQRPRVRGQFVRRIIHNEDHEEEDS